MRNVRIPALVLTALLVAACADDEQTAPLDVPPALLASPFSLWLSAERVASGPVELVAVLVNHEGVEATFGVHAKVDRWEDRKWVPYGDLVMRMDH